MVQPRQEAGLIRRQENETGHDDKVRGFLKRLEISDTEEKLRNNMLAALRPRNFQVGDFLAKNMEEFIRYNRAHLDNAGIPSSDYEQYVEALAYFINRKATSPTSSEYSTH